YTPTGTYSYAYGYGDFIGTQKFVGVRFYIGTDQHYGWIRVRLGDYLDPMTIVDWAYESTPGIGILAGDAGDITRPIPTIDAGVSTTDQQIITVDVSFNEEVQGLEIEDFFVTNGIASNLIEVTAGTEYTIEVTASTEGTVIVELPVGSVTDLSGNENSQAITSWMYALGGTAVEIASGDGIALYPNPVHDQLHIELESESDISIINTSGELVYSKKQVTSESVDVSLYVPGIYILRIERNDKIIHRKIVIE
ncbi:unnamed protein product, partial [marine sediment metagenome]